MTKYIVNSGAVKYYPDKFKKYIQELVKDLNNNPNILLCFFAQKREDWETKYIEKKEGLVTSIPKASFDMAIPDIFVEQVKKADVIIIYGGDDHLVQYWLKQFDIPKIWENKTVSVSSASSDAISTHFWTCDWRETMDGLGILPIKMIPHYKSNFGADDPRGPIDWCKAYTELENYGDKNLPIHALEEGEFVVINK